MKYFIIISLLFSTQMFSNPLSDYFGSYSLIKSSSSSSKCPSELSISTLEITEFDGEEKTIVPYLNINTGDEDEELVLSESSNLIQTPISNINNGDFDDGDVISEIKATITLEDNLTILREGSTYLVGTNNNVIIGWYKHNFDFIKTEKGVRIDITKWSVGLFGDFPYNKHTCYYEVSDK